MENNELKSFISSVVNENLVQAKTIIFDELNKKLGTSLEDKFDQYASTIFEKWDAEKADKNNDGEVSDWEKASTQWAGDETENDETKSEESDEEEEEGESEDQEDEEGDEDSEEDEEDSEEEQD